ncbi:MAG: DUF1573 domain-containing protein [Phycisphaerales bacterium]
MQKVHSIAVAAVLALTCGLAAGQGQSPEELKKLEQMKIEAENQKAAAKAAAQATATAQPTGPAGEITFDSTAVDFGNINDDKPAVHEFKFTNSGKGTLVIQSVQGSCGCTVPALQKREYAPGESGQIRVEYNPHNRRGKQHTNVTVTSNDVKNPQLKLDINSNVIPQIQIDPPLANFGNVDRGQSPVQTVMISSRSPDLKVTAVNSNSPNVTATLGEAKPAELDGSPVMQYPVELKVSPTAASGQLQALISITTTDTKRALSVSAMGEVVGTIAATPARVQLGGMAASQPINSQVRLATRNGKAFKILSVEDVSATGQKFFTTAPTIQEDNSVTPPGYFINLSATANGNGSIRGELVITTDSKEDSVIKVPYFGFIRGATPVQGGKMPGANPAGTPNNAWQQNPSTLIPE